MDQPACTARDGNSQNANPRRLEGKVAIITGGASGIGAAAVQLFWENGAKVVIADVQDQAGQALANKLGQNAVYIHCDVSNEFDIIDLVDTTVATFGELDIMYNNAGIIDRRSGGILSSTKADLERVISINLMGGFLGAKHAARVMVPRKKGCILFTGSAAASIAGLSTHPYAVSKHAIVGLAKNLAAELGMHGIRVNCVSPYAVKTNIAREIGSLDQSAEDKIHVELSDLGNLKGRILTPEDVARAALYLVSDDAGYVSGLDLVVDGGFSIVNPSMMNAFGTYNH